MARQTLASKTRFPLPAGFAGSGFGQPITDLVNGTLRTFVASLPLF
jgi:hypothetical protein